MSTHRDNCGYCAVGIVITNHTNSDLVGRRLFDKPICDACVDRVIDELGLTEDDLK